MPNPYPTPARRSLQIFALDPMIARTERRKLTLDIENEPLEVGPQGSRVQVIDYDGALDELYEPVDLDHPSVLMNDGLTPSESDPRFHQQMVYAVVMKVVENFEKALGRKLRFAHKGTRSRLRIFPHAFEGANAFYDPDRVALLFGYFRADEDNPGPNLPGQTVFTCLSHDIIAHETTHAMMHRLRKHFTEASNHDVLAFHEAFADIVAIFQHFTFREVLADTIQKTRSDLRSPSSLIELAAQFGYATGAGKALRDAIDASTEKNEHERQPPDPTLMQTHFEPHDRGSILVAAVFDAFFRVYQRRIRDLVRIATGGSGILPAGDLHPDLVNRIAGEAARTAQNILTMCIRAIEYLPPVDVTFGDFLRALVTADYQMVPDDDAGLRTAMIESFRVRGIYPEGVTSLAEDSLLWRAPDVKLELPFEPYEQRLAENARAFDRWGKTVVKDESGSLGKWAGALGGWATKNAAALGLDPAHKIHLLGFHTVFRIAPDGQLVVELIAQFDQHDEMSKEDLAFGGVPFRGGTTVIARADGVVRYIICKPLSDERRKKQKDYVGRLDTTDVALAWCDDKYEAQRMRARTNFAALHRGLY
ncbi:MAG TPA: hypothetical protein VJZ00_19355 [Thermoanaerobaculia bacterium]|nr:hypothetical protein [Thermoanaerobaculia bacterium]